MSKDFKKQATVGGSLGQYGLGWMLGGIAIGLLVGLAMYALAHKNAAAPTAATAQTSTPTTGVAEAATTPNAAVTAKAGTNPADTGNGDTPGFIYHAVLPQLEMGVPVGAQTPPTATKAVAGAKTPEVATKPLAPSATAAAAPMENNHEQKVAETKKSEEKKPVDVAAAKPVETKPVSKLTGMNGFQIGAYKTTDQAAAMQARLKTGGLNSQMVKATVNGEIWYRVRVGPADNNETMHKWQQTLSSMGISPLGVRM